MKLWTRLCLFLSAAVVLLTLARPSSAESRAQRREDKRAKVEARRQEVLERILRRDVGLDEKKAEEVKKIFAKHQPERKKLHQELRAHRRAIGQLLRDDSSDEPAYKKAVDGYRSTQKKIASLREREINDLQKVLTPKQQAKLMAAFQRLRKKLGRRGREGRD